MAAAFGMDAIPDLGMTTASISTPVQFLQAWMPGHVNALFKARKIDELVGRDIVGSVEDEEVVQSTMEYTGEVNPYGDQTNMPLSSWNQNFERFTIVRFEGGIKSMWLEGARSA